MPRGGPRPGAGRPRGSRRAAPKHRISVDLPTERHAQAVQAAEAAGCSVSALVRLALDAYLDNVAKP